MKLQRLTWFFIIGGIFIFILSCSKKDELQSFQEMVMKFDNATQRARTDNQELSMLIQEIVQEYPDSIKRILTKIDTSLTEEEYQMLERLIREEQDISLKSQLKRILELQKELQAAREELQKLRYVLPLPIEVKKGDSHYKICLNYLKENHNLTEKEARKLIEKVGLFEPLVPGFFVWNYYKDGVFGSFVTQGNAPVTPMEVYRKNKEEVQKLIADAQAKRDSALAVAQELRVLKTQLEEELSKAYGELEVTQQKIDSLRKVQESIQKRLNSLLYYVDLEKNLKKQKYLSGGIFRKTDLTQLPPLQLFDILDLRRKDGITLHAADYNLKKFSKVVVYPKSFQLDIDYKLIYNEKKDEVIIFLKRPYKFKQQKIVIAIQ
jgi:predicted RNA binding protein with dsRBD fold (UPF0201 family)